MGKVSKGKRSRLLDSVAIKEPIKTYKCYLSEIRRIDGGCKDCFREDETGRLVLISVESRERFRKVMIEQRRFISMLRQIDKEDKNSEVRTPGGRHHIIIRGHFENETSKAIVLKDDAALKMTFEFE